MRRLLTGLLQRLRPIHQRPLPLPEVGGLVCAVTDIGNKEVQQDACFAASLPGAKVIILADGISHFAGSDLVASRAVLTAYEYLRYVTTAGGQVNEGILRAIVAEVARDGAVLNRELQERNEPEGGSTLIIAAETHDYFYVAAVGDGAVVFVDGNARAEKNSLVGHGIRGYIGAPTAAIPTILAFPKTHPAGHLLFVSTDGIATSLKQPGRAGPAPEVREMTTIALVLQEIREAMEERELDRLSLKALLTPWVTGAVSEVTGKDDTIWQVGFVPDNRSIGVLIDDIAAVQGNR